MIEADLSGADAHGIFRLPQYAAALLTGKMHSTAQPVFLKTGPSTALVDGNNGLGHRIVTFATEHAIQIARDRGAPRRAFVAQTTRARAACMRRCLLRTE
jgi:L-2-hydroxycarboxylate dehydrogenase (NAD+)